MPEGVEIAPHRVLKGIVVVLEIWSKCTFGQIASDIESCFSRRSTLPFHYASSFCFLFEIGVRSEELDIVETFCGG
ncbi:hypothetical protein H6P81_005770 [Aristolochia fimbriata]|uniref:Uncharacterized protein n=1 Tax=Aristolochia fimbriata TaxID=158543 RepID=A0AAV7EZ45_ARIFI|nr:hypothetical protein H6P81_005770 [Aristolochia fimbriata]